jgi:DNA-binding NarL/FixJ family response regulator
MAAELSTPPTPAESPVFDESRGESRHDASHVVVVMEDDARTSGYIIEALQIMGVTPCTVSSADEAVALARDENARCFILDASMGGEERAQEGLEALTRIKRLDASISVAVYSNHNRLLELAKRFADVTQPKSGDHLSDIASILERLIAPHFKGMVARILAASGHISEPPQRPRLRASGEADVNKSRYRELRADSAWLKKHRGRYVAFIDGELRDADTDRQKLLGRVRREYAGRPIFFTEVKEQEESVRIFSPLRLHHS